MDRIRSSADSPAVLAGSLAAFPLLDVLDLLASTHHVGELKVVSEGTDDHFWLDGGDLIDTVGGATGRLFHLACADDAWFTVTAAPSVPRAGARMALATVVEHLAPRLAEWQALRTAVPFESTVHMAASTTLPEVHLRADQWRVLSRLGGGRRVGDVVDEADTPPIETLRLLRELLDAGLVSFDEKKGPTPDASRRPPSPRIAGQADRSAARGAASTARSQRRAPATKEPASLMPTPLGTWAALPDVETS